MFCWRRPRSRPRRASTVPLVWLATVVFVGVVLRRLTSGGRDPSRRQQLTGILTGEVGAFIGILRPQRQEKRGDRRLVDTMHQLPLRGLRPPRRWGYFEAGIFRNMTPPGATSRPRYARDDAIETTGHPMEADGRMDGCRRHRGQRHASRAAAHRTLEIPAGFPQAPTGSHRYFLL